jgi:predicted nucleotidyltransferase
MMKYSGSGEIHNMVLSARESRDLVDMVEGGDEYENDVVYLTLSGSRLGGYAKPDSDIDVRGTFIAPLNRIIGLGCARNVYENKIAIRDLICDISVNDISKTIGLLISNNSNEYEHVMNPTPIASENSVMPHLVKFAHKALTNKVCNSFRGIAYSHFQNRLSKKSFANRSTEDISLKDLFYIYRPLMAGIHLMETGKFESNIVRLNGYFHDDLIEGMIEWRSQGAITLPMDLGLEGVTQKAEELFQRIDFSAEQTTKVFRDDDSTPNQVRKTFHESVMKSGNDLLIWARSCNEGSYG